MRREKIKSPSPPSTKVPGERLYRGLIWTAIRETPRSPVFRPGDFLIKKKEKNIMEDLDLIFSDIVEMIVLENLTYDFRIFSLNDYIWKNEDECLYCKKIKADREYGRGINSSKSECEKFYFRLVELIWRRQWWVHISLVWDEDIIHRFIEKHKDTDPYCKEIWQYIPIYRCKDKSRFHFYYNEVSKLVKIPSGSTLFKEYRIRTAPELLKGLYKKLNNDLGWEILAVLYLKGIKGIKDSSKYIKWFKDNTILGSDEYVWKLIWKDSSLEVVFGWYWCKLGRPNILRLGREDLYRICVKELCHPIPGRWHDLSEAYF